MNFKDIRHYKSWNITMKAAFWFVFASVFQKALSFITVPIFTRVMTSNQYGIYSTYLSWETILSVFLTLKLDSGAYSNVLGKEVSEEEKNKITISYVSLCFALTIVATIIMIVFIIPISSFSEIPIQLHYLMMLEIFVTPINCFWAFKQRFNLKYKLLVCFIIIKSFFNVILGILLVYFSNIEQQAEARVLSIVIIDLISFIFFYIPLIKKTRKFFLIYKWGETLKFQLPLIPHYLSMTFLLSSDRIMIQKMVGATKAGIYSVAYSAGQIMTIIKTSLVDALRPWIYQQLNQKKYDRLGSIMTILTIGVTFLSIVFSAIAPELIKLLASKEYYEAIYVVPPVAVSSLFTFIYQVFVVVETYYEKTTKIMLASIFASISNLILNYLFIPLYGYIVAGYTTLISYMLLSLFHYIVICSIERKNLLGKKLFKIRFLILISLIGIIACISVSFLYEYRIIRYIIIFLLLIILYISREKVGKLYKTIKERQ